MRLTIHPENPQERLLLQAVTCLKQGGVIIYPTDTMYGLGCDITNKKAVNRICTIKGISPDKVQLSCVCESLSIIGSYANQVSTPMYKMMKRAFPGPYTFILKASKEIPKHFQHKKTVGIRVSSHPIPHQLSHLLGNPIASISLPYEEEEMAYSMDPDLIYERFGHQVDMMIDGGYGNLDPSTVIDLSEGEEHIQVIRLGSGELEKIGLTLEEA